MTQLLTSFVRIARAGQTVDGREVSAAHIKQMAANYDPEIYGARVNKEHFRAWIRDEEVPTLGDVVALKAEKDSTDTLCLCAQISPTSHLVKLNENRQKVYTSVEYDVDKVDGKPGAYLFGLAVTDSPASTGTTMLKFSIQHKDTAPPELTNLDHYFSEAIETTFATEQQKDTVLDKVKALFARNTADTDAKVADLSAAVELMAAEIVELGSKSPASAALSTSDAETITALRTDYSALKEEFTALVTALETTPGSGYTKRPASSGTEIIQANC